MRSWMHKYRKRMLVAVVAIMLPPLVVVLLLWWDAQPKPDAKVSVGYLKTVTQGGSNVVTFVVTNQSDFPVCYFVSFLTPNNAGTEGWEHNYPSPTLSIWQRGNIPPRTNAQISVAAFSTNRWGISIFGQDSRVSELDKARGWMASRVYPHGIYVDQANWIIGCKAKVFADGPEMMGDYPAPPMK